MIISYDNIANIISILILNGCQNEFDLTKKTENLSNLPDIRMSSNVLKTIEGGTYELTFSLSTPAEEDIDISINKTVYGVTKEHTIRVLKGETTVTKSYTISANNELTANQIVAIDLISANNIKLKNSQVVINVLDFLLEDVPGSNRIKKLQYFVSDKFDSNIIVNAWLHLPSNYPNTDFKGIVLHWHGSYLNSYEPW